jgi:asparagine synthase (glutamine-hydrolysing)
MCGITGIYALEPQVSWSSDEISSVILRMTATLANRGPDATGQVIAPPVAFGHRRLSILDLSNAGAQPPCALMTMGR